MVARAAMAKSVSIWYHLLSQEGVTGNEYCALFSIYYYRLICFYALLSNAVLSFAQRYLRYWRYLQSNFARELLRPP